MLPPPRHQSQVDLDNLVQQMEDDMLSHFAWQVITATTRAMTALFAALQRVAGMSEGVECAEGV